MEITRSREIELFGEHVFLSRFSNRTQSIQNGNGSDCGEWLARLAKAYFGAGDPLLKKMLIEWHREL